MAYRLGYLLRISVVIAGALVTAAAHAQVDSGLVDQDLAAANRSINEGQVKEGIDRLSSSFGKIDPERDPAAYWRTGAMLVEALSQTENHADAGRILPLLASSKLAKTLPALSEWMQLFIGRNLAYQGKASEGETYLRSLTAGDARHVFVPAQRAAAIVLSDIELGRDNIGQAAIWMRRAVIGTLVDSGAASEEIVDVLASYATYLRHTRRLPEARRLSMKLLPLYEALFAHRSPKYLKFASNLLGTLAEMGDFQATGVAYEVLTDRVATVDVVAQSVREELFFQELYQLARAYPAGGSNSVTERLKSIVARDPGVLKQLRSRVIFSYFALLANDADLADQFLSTVETSPPSGGQFEAYEIALKSFIAARRNNFEESVALARFACFTSASKMNPPVACRRSQSKSGWCSARSSA